MARLFLTALILIAVWVPSADAGLAQIPTCCACEKSGAPISLFCARVPEDETEALSVKCQGLGGELLCKLVEIGATTCTFEDLACPASPAPAMSRAPLAALALLLGTVGIATIRRRARRWKTR